MAVTTHKPRAKSGARKAAGAVKPSAHHGASPVRKAKTKAAKSAAHAAASPGSAGGKLARKTALTALTRAGARAVSAGGAAARAATERALDATATSTSPATHGRPPIQAAVDAAVPCQVAWDEWMTLEWVPDSAGEITGPRRGRNGKLRGKLRHDRWSAEVTEVHAPHSFAWRATRGSDCAGLITFHPLSEWLTRIELSLDARPVRLSQAVALVSHRADRRTRADLRRFKARLELISPDDYSAAQD
jgi:uncharacterized membrane protein